MKRRVLVLNHFAAPRSAAGGTRHVELFGRLERWEARIIAADRNYLTGERITSDDMLTTVKTFGFAGSGPMRVVNWLSFSVQAFFRGLRAPRPSVVYASSPHLLTGLIGLSLSRIRRSTFVLEIRDMWPQVLVDMGAVAEGSVLHRLLASLERFLYEKADAVVALADGLRDQVVERGASSERTFVIPNGPDPDDFIAPDEREAMRARYGLQGTVIAYTGAHGPANGLDAVLDAADALRAEQADVLFLLVGDGADKARLVDRARREGITNVRFLDPVPKHEMPALLAAVDAGVVCFADRPIFRRHMSANKLYDYMAAGIPVVNAVPGEGARYVETSGAGVNVEPNQLTQGVRTLMEMTHEERDRLGAAGRRYIAKNQSRTAMAARLEAVLDSLAPCV